MEEADRLSLEERQMLLVFARQALQQVVCGERLSPLELDLLPARLREPGASFVTLTRLGQLRGCIGALEALLPLAEDVRQHAIAAALHDYRFPPVLEDELPEIAIEISRLTRPVDLVYASPEELLVKLRPGIDGVVLRDGGVRSTFLPQVWHKISDPEDFLSHLCYKMGAAPDLWRCKPLQIQIYQVEEFQEEVQAKSE